MHADGLHVRVVNRLRTDYKGHVLCVGGLELRELRKLLFADLANLWVFFILKVRAKQVFYRIVILESILLKDTNVIYLGEVLDAARIEWDHFVLSSSVLGLDMHEGRHDLVVIKRLTGLLDRSFDGECKLHIVFEDWIPHGRFR